MSEDIRKRKMLLRDFQNGVTVQQAMQNIADEFEPKSYGIRTVQRWFKRFREGDLDICESPRQSVRVIKSKVQQARGLFRDGEQEQATTKTVKKPPTKSKSKPAKAKKVNVELVSCKQEYEPQDQATSDLVQKLIQKKLEITVSKVRNGLAARKDPVRPDVISKRLVASSRKTNHNCAPPSRNAAPTMKSVKLPIKRASTVPANRLEPKQQKITNGRPSDLKIRAVRSIEANLMLPPVLAERMSNNYISTEKHSLSDSSRTSQGSNGEPVKKSITVQFQNVSPEIAKSTVRKSSDSSGKSSTSGKRSTMSSLSSPKGVIYLKPQEIFRQNFNIKKREESLKRVIKKPPFGSHKLGTMTYTTSAHSTINPSPKTQPVVPVQVLRAQVVEVDDSDTDSENDLIFPENVSVPVPKDKQLPETFTTYWDMQTDKPILLNPVQEELEPLLPAAPGVIVID